MSRKLLLTATIVAIALTAPIGSRTADAHGGGFGGGGFHGGGFHGGDFRGRDFHDRDFFHDRGFVGRRDFRDDGIRFGGFFGGFYPGYYGYGTCYLTIYGTTVCY